MLHTICYYTTITCDSEHTLENYATQNNSLTYVPCCRLLIPIIIAAYQYSSPQLCVLLNIASAGPASSTFLCCVCYKYSILVIDQKCTCIFVLIYLLSMWTIVYRCLCCSTHVPLLFLSRIIISPRVIFVTCPMFGHVLFLPCVQC